LETDLNAAAGRIKEFESGGNANPAPGCHQYGKQREMLNGDVEPEGI